MAGTGQIISAQSRSFTITGTGTATAPISLPCVCSTIRICSTGTTALGYVGIDGTAVVPPTGVTNGSAYTNLGGPFIVGNDTDMSIPNDTIHTISLLFTGTAVIQCGEGA